jgi:hypothetical protein
MQPSAEHSFAHWLVLMAGASSAARSAASACTPLIEKGGLQYPGDAELARHIANAVAIPAPSRLAAD